MSIYDRRNHEERKELTKDEASLPPNKCNITVPDVDRRTQVLTLAHVKTVAEEATVIVEVERRHQSTFDGGAPSTAAAPPRRAPPAGQASRTDDARARARAWAPFGRALVRARSGAPAPRTSARAAAFPPVTSLRSRRRQRLVRADYKQFLIFATM